MNRRKAVVEVERSLMSLQISVEMEAERHDELLDLTYKMIREDVERARAPLRELGMYDEVHAVLTETETLLRQARYEDAGTLIYYTYRKLMQKSGTDERMARRFGGSKAGAATRPRPGDLEDGFGPPEPDAYQERFLQLAAAADIQAVRVVAGDLEQLRTALAVTAVGVDAGIIAKVKQALAHCADAEAPLRKLGLYRMLAQTLDAAESLHVERDHRQAEELVEEVLTYLRERMGSETAGRTERQS